jgi:hypothetical protein
LAFCDELAQGVQNAPTMMRKLAALFAALLIPGGLTALLGVWLFKRAARTPWGQRRILRARELAAPFTLLRRPGAPSVSPLAAAARPMAPL